MLDGDLMAETIASAERMLKIIRSTHPELCSVQNFGEMRNAAIVALTQLIGMADQVQLQAGLINTLRQDYDRLNEQLESMQDGRNDSRRRRESEYQDRLS